MPRIIVLVDVVVILVVLWFGIILCLSAWKQFKQGDKK